MKNDVNSLHKRAIFNASNENWKLYKSGRNSYVNEFREAEKSYVKNQLHCAAGNNKKMWKVLKFMLEDKKHKQIDKVIWNGEEVTNQIEIAEILNNFFVKSVVEINKSIDYSGCSFVDNGVNSVFELKCVN